MRETLTPLPGNIHGAFGTLESPYLNGGQQLAVKYFAAAMVLFLAQLLFGLLAAIQFVWPGFLFNIIDFSVNRMVHINAMVLWMLYGFIGSVYWFLEEESGTHIAGLRWGEIAFYVLTGAVAVVVLVYLLIQTGPGNDATRWLVNEGREYIEAPRWADLGIVAVMGVFFYLAVQQWRGRVWMGEDQPGNGWKWKWAMILLNLGVIGMTVALLIAGYEQSFIERAVEGSSWGGYFVAQAQPWFTQSMIWRLAFGVMTLGGAALLAWDLLTIGAGETRKALAVEPEEEPVAEPAGAAAD